MSLPKLIRGTVEHGDDRGRRLGFPTANLTATAESLPPGIYAAWAQLPPGTEKFPAVIHCGPRPMFPEAPPAFEVHLINFPDHDLYGHEMLVTPVQFIRASRAFESPEALRDAIRNDIQRTLEILQR